MHSYPISMEILKMNLMWFINVFMSLIPIALLVFLLLRYRGSRHEKQERTIRELEQMLSAQAKVVKKDNFVYSFMLTGKYNSKNIVLKVFYGTSGLWPRDCPKIPWDTNFIYGWSAAYAVCVDFKLTDEQIQRYGRNFRRLKTGFFLKNLLMRKPIFVLEHGFLHFDAILFVMPCFDTIVRIIKTVTAIETDDLESLLAEPKKMCDPQNHP